LPNYRDEGVVLKTTKLGEADRIVTILTLGHGKVRAVGKGVRRTKSRFGARLEPFMRDDLLLATGRTFDIVSQCVCLSPYAESIAQAYDAFVSANAIVETADKLVATEHEPVRDQYLLVISALNALSRRLHAPNDISNSYVLRALSLAGWAPRLNSCVVCGRADGLNWFSVPLGGCVCDSDRTTDSHHFNDSEAAIVKALLSGDWEVLDERGGSQPEGSRLGINHLVEDWGEYYLERPLRSLKLVDY
jgi:DNA repair protein RecO (recombination protein O)